MGVFAIHYRSTNCAKNVSDWIFIRNRNLRNSSCVSFAEIFRDSHENSGSGIPSHRRLQYSLYRDSQSNLEGRLLLLLTAGIES